MSIYILLFDLVPYALLHCYLLLLNSVPSLHVHPYFKMMSILKFIISLNYLWIFWKLLVLVTKYCLLSLMQLSYLWMEKLFKGRLKGRGGWSHSPRELRTDQDTMTEPDTCAEGKMCGKINARPAMYIYLWWRKRLFALVVELVSCNYEIWWLLFAVLKPFSCYGPSWLWAMPKLEQV